jgi:hypothetical protein
LEHSAADQNNLLKDVNYYATPRLD